MAAKRAKSKKRTRKRKPPAPGRVIDEASLDESFADLVTALVVLAGQRRHLKRRRTLNAATDIIRAVHRAVTINDERALDPTMRWALTYLREQNMQPMFGAHPDDTSEQQLRFLSAVREAALPLCSNGKPDSIRPKEALARATLTVFNALDDRLAGWLPTLPPDVLDIISTTIDTFVGEGKKDLRRLARALLRALGASASQVNNLFKGRKVEAFLDAHEDLSQGKMGTAGGR